MIDSVAENTRYLDASAPSAQQALRHTLETRVKYLKSKYSGCFHYALKMSCE